MSERLTCCRCSEGETSGVTMPDGIRWATTRISARQFGQAHPSFRESRSRKRSLQRGQPIRSMVDGAYPLFVEKNHTNEKNLANVAHAGASLAPRAGSYWCMDRRERQTDIALAILAGASVLGIVLIRRVS